jgi:hypothetical protein
MIGDMAQFPGVMHSRSALRSAAKACVPEVASLSTN